MASVNNLIIIDIALLHIWFGMCKIRILSVGKISLGQLIFFLSFLLIPSLSGYRLMTCYIHLISRDLITSRIWHMGKVARNSVNLDRKGSSLIKLIPCHFLCFH